MIRTVDLTKSYNGFTAVHQLNLHVERGQIYGFLGPNGAGKTTTILMLLGILLPTAGQIYVADQPLDRRSFDLKRRIGVVSEHAYLYDDMTAYEYLDFFADLYRVSPRDKARRIGTLMEAVQLYEYRDVRAYDYSHGMKQKLGFVRALLHDPDLLILDEPVSGLDPHGILQIRNLILEENARGKTVFISSHILSEIERTAHRVGIINHGELQAEASVTSIRQRLSQEGRLEIELLYVDPKVPAALSVLPFVRGVRVDGRTVGVRTEPGQDYRAEVSRALSRLNAIILGMRSLEMTLEEAFVTITEHNISMLTEAD